MRSNRFDIADKHQEKGEKSQGHSVINVGADHADGKEDHWPGYQPGPPVLTCPQGQAHRIYQQPGESGQTGDAAFRQDHQEEVVSMAGPAPIEVERIRKVERGDKIS